LAVLISELYHISENGGSNLVVWFQLPVLFLLKKKKWVPALLSVLQNNILHILPYLFKTGTDCVPTA
jgi:hypothetical protein